MCCCFGLCNPPVKSRRVSSPFATPTVILVGSKCLHFEAQDTPPTAHQTTPSHFYHLGHPNLIRWLKTALHLDNPSSLCLYICPLPQILPQIKETLAPSPSSPSSTSSHHHLAGARHLAGIPPELSTTASSLLLTAGRAPPPGRPSGQGAAAPAISSSPRRPRLTRSQPPPGIPSSDRIESQPPRSAST